MKLSEKSRRYLSSQSHGTLATAGPDGRPQNKPVGFRYNAELDTIDISGFNMGASAKYRNLALRPDVAFTVDDAFGEGPEGVRFVEVRGPAEQVTVEPPPSGLSPEIIRIHPRRVISWNVDPEHPGLQTQNLDAQTETIESARPTLGVNGAVAQEARGAVDRLVAELQAGWDRRDADVTDGPLAGR